MKTADIHSQLQALISSCIDEGDYDPAEDYIKDPFCRRTMHTASLAINEIDTLRARVAELEAAESALVRHGFRKCNIAACNCGSWHHVGGLAERFDEIASDLSDAGYPLSNDNGHIARRALASLVASRDSWKREALAWRAWKKCVVNYWTAENPDPQPLIDEMKAARAANGEVGQ